MQTKMIVKVSLFLIAALFIFMIGVYLNEYKNISLNYKQSLVEKEDAIKEFEPNIKKAIDKINEIDVAIGKTLPHDKNKYEILAIGFPEVIRWNEFQDMIEMAIDRNLYIKHGSSYADFSIGMFQMKPSFIETLEKYIIENALFESNKSLKLILAVGKTELSRRANRIDRMEQTEWQLLYLKAYWAVANHKFKDLSFSNKKEQIRFYASAYNFGFLKPIEEISNWQTKKMFPYGKNYKGSQMAYCDVSIAFLDFYPSIFL